MKKQSEKEYLSSLKAARNALLFTWGFIAGAMVANLIKGKNITIWLCLIAVGIAVFWVSKVIMQKYTGRDNT